MKSTTETQSTVVLNNGSNRSHRSFEPLFLPLKHARNGTLGLPNPNLE